MKPEYSAIKEKCLFFLSVISLLTATPQKKKKKKKTECHLNELIPLLLLGAVLSYDE